VDNFASSGVAGEEGKWGAQTSTDPKRMPWECFSTLFALI